GGEARHLLRRPAGDVGRERLEFGAEPGAIDGDHTVMVAQSTSRSPGLRPRLPDPGPRTAPVRLRVALLGFAAALLELLEPLVPLAGLAGLGVAAAGSALLLARVAAGGPAALAAAPGLSAVVAAVAALALVAAVLAGLLGVVHLL